MSSEHNPIDLSFTVNRIHEEGMLEIHEIYWRNTQIMT